MQSAAQDRKSYTLHPHDLLMGEQVDGYVLKVRDLAEPDKPREKLARLGPQSLSLTELIAAILGVGTRKEEVFAMAQRIAQEYGETALNAETSPAKMASALNIPTAKACQLIAAFELGRRYYAAKAGRTIHVRNARQAYEYLQAIGHSDKEQLRGLYLNSRYEVVHDELISVGSLTASIIHPREVFRPAIERGAVAVIIAHNHPSGNPAPTAEDIAATKQLVAAGKLLGIELLDHLVITSEQFVRIKEGVDHAR